MSIYISCLTVQKHMVAGGRLWRFVILNILRRVATASNLLPTLTPQSALIADTPHKEDYRQGLEDLAGTVTHPTYVSFSRQFEHLLAV